MKRAWRIVKDKHVATAFSGEGARRFGGRWNSAGTSVVYTSGTLALAALELLVHLHPPVMTKYVAIPVEFDEGLLEAIAPNTLPADWKEEPPPPSTKRIGDTWVLAARSAVLGLPSVLVPGEPNYVLNPAHRDFQRIVIGQPEPFSFDPRFL